MTLRSLTIALLFALSTLSALSQEVTRAEFSPYALRKDAEARTHSELCPRIEFAPTVVASAEGQTVREQVLDVPQSWLDATAFLHIEGVGSAYSLEINGKVVVECEDSFTPSDYNISPYIKVGANSLRIISRNSATAQLEEGLEHSNRKPLEGSYIYTQSRLRIVDYRVEVISTEDGKDGQLLLDVVVENFFHFDETIEVGFDIYDPAGKLTDFSTAKVTLAGGKRDTIRFSPHLYDARKWLWSPDSAVGMQKIGRPVSRYTDQNLYTVMIFTKQNRVSSNYIPFEVGFISPSYAEGKLSGIGNPISLRGKRYNALSDEANSEAELRSIRLEGFNTVLPDYPQPLWFYSLCDKLGLYVIDQAAISAPTLAEDRSVGGTPSNDPALKDEYLLRVQKMYHRSRNFSCVVGYSLGSPSGNGYNMYKAYEWLKGVEKRRPIIYTGAGEEWNNDPLTIE